MTQSLSTDRWRRLPWWVRSAILSIPQLLLIVAAFVPSIIDNQESLPPEVRTFLNVLLLVLVVPIAVLSIVFTARGERERQSLDRRLKLLEPGRSLDPVTRELFKTGAWRLSLFSVDGDLLTRRDSVSIHAHWSDSAPRKISLQPSPFRALFERNLAGSNDRLHDESPAWLVDQTAPDVREQWLAWRETVFGRQDALEESSEPMMARKYAWYAVRDDDTRLVWAILCESMAGNGVNVEYLGSRDTAVWVLLWARMLDAAGK